MDGSQVQVAEVVPTAGVLRTLARDVDDFVSAAFAAHRDEIHSFLSRTTRDDSEAEDLLQETFVRLARQVRDGRTPDQVRPWLYRVAANLATSRFRRGAVVRRWIDRFGAAEHASHVDASPEARFLGRERSDELERALRVISPEARLALLMAAQGFSGREIAAAIRRSEVATRVLMSRARVRVRTELEKDEP